MRRALLLGLLLVLAGCVGSGGPTPTPQERTVTIQPDSPTPAERTVTVHAPTATPETAYIVVNRTVIVTQPSPTPKVRVVTRTVEVTRTVTVEVTPTPTASPTPTATPEPAVGEWVKAETDYLYRDRNGTRWVEIDGVYTNNHDYAVRFNVYLEVYGAGDEPCTTYVIDTNRELGPDESLSVYTEWDTSELDCDVDFKYIVGKPRRVE